ncbi:M14 family metallopeptidase [Rhodohalobacter sp. 614A]|uniref:M14 family metallopeptidase n=1 Tax=Rhodohalobacter sp. 614A TaxID=2908649 RepID=UPI001F1DCC02|nr:M14 family metallopeptidase [Rhodohalobacter sp. 614A]
MNKLSLVLISVITFLTHFGTAFATQNTSDLSGIFSPGYMLFDTTSDSLIDKVNGKLILPDKPTEAQIIAASNIAARIGFETTAMDLDLVRFQNGYSAKEGEIAIWIDPDANSTSLAPGQGFIQLKDSDLSVKGYDATGLLAASNYLSGMYPAVDGNSNYDLEGFKKKILTLLGDKEIEFEDILFDKMIVSSGKKGITKMFATITGSGDIFEEEYQLSSDERTEWKQKLLGSGIYQLELNFQDANILTFQSDSTQPQSEGNGGDHSSSASAFFDISEFYTISGIYTDTNKDKVPDDSRSYIAYAGTESPVEFINFAARAGFETAGLKLPFVFPANEMDTFGSQGFPVLVGVTDRIKGKLADDDSLTSSENGRIEIREEMFGEETNGLIITGSDEIQLSAALTYMTHHLPYVWDFGKGNVTLEEVQTEARRFFQGISGAGQVANGIEKLDTWLSRLEGKELENLDIELAAKEIPEGLDSFISQRVQNQVTVNQVDVETYKTGFGVDEPIFSEEITIPWEVNDFWEMFNADVLPNITENSKGSIVLRVSESPEIREQIKEQIYDKLNEKSVSEEDIDVQVLNAYKQGFSWIENVVIPQLKDEKVDSINIQYKHLRDSEEIKWQTSASKTRWLQEIYPIDTFLENELDISSVDVSFTPVYSPDHTYTFEAFDKKGETVFSDVFDPKYVIRPYFDLFPEYDSLRVTTGWLTAEIDGEKIADDRIKTDLERFWDHMQTDTYQKVLDYVMDIQDGKPDPDLAPYFDELKFEITLSEPDYRLGILEEQISSLEALHEDIYFETILFFDLIGNRYGVGDLSYPGRILPYIMPSEDGKPGHAKIYFTGKKKGRPEVVLRYKEKDHETKELYYELPNIQVEEPALTGLEIGADEEIANLIFELDVDKEENPYEELKARGSESYIDNVFISSERLTGILNAHEKLRENNLFSSSLSVEGIKNITFRFALEDSTGWISEKTLTQTSEAQPIVRSAPYDENFEYSGQNLVQWDTPIPPAETNEILSKLNTFDNIQVYYAATSLLGEKVYVMDLLPPTESRYISQAKLNAMKPTLFISGRQHANEFSSTSHILKLAEKAATDPEYSKYLNKVNLVLHPITNPDGANLAVDLNKINPYHMHHAGYLGPLAVDITRDQNNLDPRYEVAKVRREVQEEWLPDVYINMHGYPPHEWVQYFAGYSAWMSSRDRGPRSNNYWIPRGYFLTGFSWYDHEDFSSSKDLSFALLDSISAHVDAVPEMRKVNLEMQTRYKKYRSQEDAYGEFYMNDIWVNAPLKGIENTGDGYRDPRITYFSLVSEAPDEPAAGEWMQMNAAAGVAHSTGALQYLYNGKFDTTTTSKSVGDRFLRSKYRVKPVLPDSLYEKYHSEVEE